ncbi:Lsr2 family protein [Streptomyces sp. NPDC090075]|uniref:histone-like nucleoid-structuring protein Lsr2 n=1 Tax=Streptomyces sp. NPDC090075 TaxID=3365937 RepID=UPI003810EBFC
MAKKVVTTDDLDPKQEAAETITYGIDGQYREIDLSDANAKKLRDALAPFNKVSRSVDPKVGARRFSGSGNGQMGFAYGDYDSQAVRTWAQEQGLEVNDKGRVPDDIVRQYFAAQAQQQPVNGSAAR